MLDTHGSQEVGEVRAATHADVLAGVHHLPGCGVGERSGAAAKPVTRFEYRYFEAVLRQADRGR